MKTKTILRKIGSLFFLGIFLWFYAVKDIHDIMHVDDEHCHVQNAKHFHNQEHHCPICDIVFSSFDDQTPKVKVSSHNFFVKVQNLYTVQVVSCKPVSLSPSRAPPSIA